jgi:hypothetical protein
MGGCGIGDLANLELGRDSPQALCIISAFLGKWQQVPENSGEGGRKREEGVVNCGGEIVDRGQTGQVGGRRKTGATDLDQQGRFG